MIQYKTLLTLITAYWLYPRIDCNIRDSLQSHIIGGYQNIQMRNSKIITDCTQFVNDYEILNNLPFLIMINPMDGEWNKSYAYMDNTNTFVKSLIIRDMNNVVPESIFCLKKVQYLRVSNMLFSNNKVSDALANMQQLVTLVISDTPITDVTDTLSTLSQLSNLRLINCSLSQLPDLTGLSNLFYVSLSSNFLSQLNGLGDIGYLELSNNLFTEIPTMASSKNINFLSMNQNPLEHLMTLSSFVNIKYVYLQNTTISWIPSDIDKLQKLEKLDLSLNRLSQLPENIFMLKQLESVYLNNNPFSNGMRKMIKSEFNKVLPNATIFI